MKFNLFEKKPSTNEESTPLEYKGLVGDRLEKTAEEMIKISKNRDVFCDFNGTKIEVKKGEDISVEGLVNRYKKENARKMADYLDSPEYKETKEKEKKETLEKQAKMNVLMNELPNLDFSNFKDVLDWMCNIEKYAIKSVEFNNYKIIKSFNDHGYEIGANVGKNFNGEDKENFAKYIIGQALDGLYTHHAPHQMIHTFTNQWKEKFEK